MSEAEAEQAAPTGVRKLWDEVGTFLVAIALALAIRAFIIEPYRIPSESMLPTLLIGDHLFVNKFAYGVKLPFTDARLPALREPERGDVVVFNVARDARGGIYPAASRPEFGQEQFVKRLVAVPGDTVEVRGGKLYLNDQPVPHDDTGETFRDKDGRLLRVGREDLNGHVHAVLDEPRVNGPEFARRTLGDDEYLMIGDNRDLSNDGRLWGTIRKADMKGPAFILYWSWDWDGAWSELLNPLTWWELLTSRMRWDRIGDRVI
jgi:signal peptidase I